MEHIEDFFDRLDRRIEKVKRKINGRSWDMLKGTTYYINSEFKCPTCSQSIPTGLVYLVDEQRKKVLGCWYADTMQPVANTLNEPWHPHVDSSGSICMGNATTVGQLLFNGVAAGKHHRHTDKWLLNVVDHKCPKMSMSVCVVCQVDFPRVNALVYGVHSLRPQYTCSSEHYHQAHKTLCQRCGDPLGQGHIRNRCAACFEIDAIACKGCGAKHLPIDMWYIKTNYLICTACKEHRHGPCSLCKHPTLYKELLEHGNGRCTRCQFTKCRRCRSDHYRRNLNDDMICMWCEPPPHRCPCGSSVQSEGDICTSCTRCSCCFGRVEWESTSVDRCIKCVNCLGAPEPCLLATPITNEAQASETQGEICTSSIESSSSGSEA